MRLSRNGKSTDFETIFNPKLALLMKNSKNPEKLNKTLLNLSKEATKPKPTKKELEMSKQQNEHRETQEFLKFLMREMRFSNDSYFRDSSRMRTFEDPEKEIFERDMVPIELMSDTLFTDFSIDMRAIPRKLATSDLESLCSKHNLILKEVLSALSLLNEIREEIRGECLKQYEWLDEAIKDNSYPTPDNLSIIEFFKNQKNEF